MKRFGGAAAAVWMLGTALLGAIPVRAETEEPELEADDKDPVIDRQSLRAANNNPITARRRALRNDLTTLIDRLPATLDASIAAMPQPEKERIGAPALEDLKSKFKASRVEAVQMRDKVSKRMYGSSLEGLEKRFPGLRDEMFSLLYQVEAHRHFNDPQRFREYTQKKIDVQAAIDMAQKQKASKTRRETLARYEKTLSGNPDLAELERIYDNMGARQVDSRQAVITTDVSANTSASAFVSSVKISPVVGSQVSAFKPQPRSNTFKVTVPPPSVATKAYIPIIPYSAAPSDFSGSNDEISGSEFGKFMKVNAPSSTGARAVFTKAINAVSKWSDTYNLNPLLVMSFMGQESLFVGWERARTVVSHAGAGGLMQLMPGTARAMGVTDRWDVDQNIMGGAKYIRDQRKNFSNEAEFRKLDAIMAWGAQQVVQQGRSARAVWNEVWNMVPTGVKNAIGAYNSGPGRIWQFGGYANLPSWLRETKNYVPGVLQKYFQHSIDYLKRGGNAPVVA